MVCYKMCTPDNSFDAIKPASGLFTSEYSCYRNGLFKYEESAKTEEEGDDGGDEPEEKDIDV